MGDQKKCWAEVLGKCSTDMSSEHPVAANQFDTPNIVMSGYTWCVEPKEIGLNKAGGRILCRQHNSDLSELDAAALDFKNALNWAMSKPEWDWHYRRTVDGNRLERYFFKATVGSIYRADPTPTAGLFGADGLPTPHVVRAIYGVEPFEESEGIGMVHQVGNTFSTEQRYAIAPWIRKTDHALVGAQWEYRGFRFWIRSKDAPEVNDHMALSAPRPAGAQSGLTIRFSRTRCEVFIAYVRQASGPRLPTGVVPPRPG